MEFSPTIIIAVLLIVIVGAVLGWFFARRVHASKLKDRYGEDEYAHTVSARGKNAAHSEMDGRKKHVDSLKIHELTQEERDQYYAEWSEVQSNFVDEPGEAIIGADRLIQNVMRQRAYPVSDFEQRASDLSVTYPALVSNYRAARLITLKQERGEASTEELREAMIHYRSLFDELLGAEEEI